MLLVLRCTTASCLRRVRRGDGMAGGAIHRRRANESVLDGPRRSDRSAVCCHRDVLVIVTLGSLPSIHGGTEPWRIRSFRCHSAFRMTFVRSSAARFGGKECCRHTPSSEPGGPLRAAIPAHDHRDHDHVRLQLRGGVRRHPADAAADCSRAFRRAHVTPCSASAGCGRNPDVPGTRRPRRPRAPRLSRGTDSEPASLLWVFQGRGWYLRWF